MTSNLMIVNSSVTSIAVHNQQFYKKSKQ